MCLYVTSVKLSGSRAKVNSPALGSGVMEAEMFFLRNPGTPVGFWLGPGRGQGERQSPRLPPPSPPRSAPTRTHTTVALLPIMILHLNNLSADVCLLFFSECTQRRFTASLTLHQYPTLLGVLNVFFNGTGVGGSCPLPATNGGRIHKI